MAEELTSSSDFFTEVRGILTEARNSAARTVNTAMVEAYWQIGRRIVEEEQSGEAKATYGERLIPELSRSLTTEFGKGFSLANLKNFRKFYLTYPNGGKSYTLCSLLSWSHNRLIMREEEPQARVYYLEEARRQNWSVRQLQRQLKTRTYQRLLSTKASTEPESLTPAAPSILDFIKDPYVLEFLALPEDPAATETDIETAIIDLKTTKLNHQDIGQIDMYVRMFDDLKRGPDDNPTIGLILCADKDETIVRYSVLEGSEQLFASKYQTLLPTVEELTAELERRLVDAQQQTDEEER